jgi:hypothetical protein
MDGRVKPGHDDFNLEGGVSELFLGKQIDDVARLGAAARLAGAALGLLNHPSFGGLDIDFGFLEDLNHDRFERDDMAGNIVEMIDLGFDRGTYILQMIPQRFDVAVEFLDLVEKHTALQSALCNPKL